MPKKTFYNLSDDKRKLIEDVLRDEFSRKPYQDCNVKAIVDRLSIARGSFYQYFDDLRDCYFYILDKDTQDIHLLFMSILRENNNAIFKSLNDFGKRVCDVIFSKDKYNIYKFRYLYWNNDLNDSWEDAKNEYYKIFRDDSDSSSQEIIHFVKAVIHSLIERNFKEEWSKEVFLEKYTLHIHWLKKGLENEDF